MLVFNLKIAETGESSGLCIGIDLELTNFKLLKKRRKYRIII